MVNTYISQTTCNLQCSVISNKSFNPLQKDASLKTPRNRKMLLFYKKIRILMVDVGKKEHHLHNY